MMKQAYLIIAHNNFENLEALIRRLDCPEVYIYMHIDLKADAPKSIGQMKTANPMVILRNHRVHWGDRTQVLTELDLFAQAYKNPEIEWFHLISGNDFPLGRIEDINLFYEEADSTDCFMESEPIPPHLAPRMELYHFFVRRPGSGNAVISRLSDRFLALQHRIGIRRRLPCGRRLMYGSGWADFRRVAVRKLLERRAQILRSTRFSSCADEIYKQTFLQDCGLRIADDNLRYIDWSARKPSPKSLLLEDFKPMMESGKLFARKFDSSDAPELRRRIIAALR